MINIETKIDLLLIVIQDCADISEQAYYARLVLQLDEEEREMKKRKAKKKAVADNQ